MLSGLRLHLGLYAVEIVVYLGEDKLDVVPVGPFHFWSVCPFVAFLAFIHIAAEPLFGFRRYVVAHGTEDCMSGFDEEEWGICLPDNRQAGFL